MDERGLSERKGTMKAFEISELTQRLRQSDDAYLEFLRVPALSAGLYRLPAGGSDPQLPHHEDEVYIGLAGRAQIRVGDEDRQVKEGSVVFVAAEVEHGFHSIDEDLVVLVLFAPAETP
jgi:mannose-6-phosphate isomerase-like protein (cupin superfamily)